MSARLVCDRLVLQELPFKLDPLWVANELTKSNWSGEASFATAVTIRYTPNVSTSTPGEAILAISAKPCTDYKSASAAACKVVVPVWKNATLVAQRDLLTFENWSRSGTPHLWLSGIGLRGTLDISCTIKGAVQLKLPPSPESAEVVSTLDTHCYLGPVLAGFSLVGCMPYSLQPPWGGAGQVININLADGKGRTSGNRYILTPENKPYVAVRYGFGSKFSYTFDSQNKPYSWKSNTQVIWAYKENGAGTGAVGVDFFASWRPIHGSTYWWAEINPSSISAVLGGQAITWYYPCCQLILYYEFPGVDIFAPDFNPGIQVLPTGTLPCPPGDAQPGKLQLLPMNTTKLQAMWNAHWNPRLAYENAGRELRYRFTDAKYSLTKWPVNCVNNRQAASSDNAGCEEGLGESKDAVGPQGEPAWIRTDSSA